MAEPGPLLPHPYTNALNPRISAPDIFGVSKALRMNEIIVACHIVTYNAVLERRWEDRRAQRDNHTRTQG